MGRRAGSAKAKKGRKKTGFNKKQMSTVRKEARKVLLAEAETKALGAQSQGSPTTPAEGLKHNIPYYAGALLAVKQGVADPNDYSTPGARIGDEIQLMNVNVRFMLSSFRPNVTYKLLLFWYSSNLTSLTNGDVFYTQGNKLLDRYDTENISIIDQKIIAPNIGALPASDPNNRQTRLVTLNGSWKGKKIIYNEGGFTPKFKDIGFMVVAYDSVNTLQTDQLGEIVYDYKMKFKDI